MNLTPTGFRRRSGHDRHVCIVVQNLPVPFDRRVWLECRSLRAAGYEVSVVCPKGKGDPAHHVIEGVQLFKYRPFPPITHQAMFLLEYAWSILATFVNLAQAWRSSAVRCRAGLQSTGCALRRRTTLQAGFRRAHGYDQHDLCPELYESRFAGQQSLPYRALVLAERDDLCARVARDHDERVLPRGGPATRRQAAGRGHRRAHRARTRSGCARSTRKSRCAEASRSPPGLHRGDGPAGRRRPTRSARCTTSCTCAAAPTSALTLIGDGDAGT